MKRKEKIEQTINTLMSSIERSYDEISQNIDKFYLMTDSINSISKRREQLAFMFDILYIVLDSDDTEEIRSLERKATDKLNELHSKVFSENLLTKND